MTALRVTPPSSLAIWLALLPSDHMDLRVSTRSSVQDIGNKLRWGDREAARWRGGPEGGSRAFYLREEGGYKHRRVPAAELDLGVWKGEENCGGLAHGMRMERVWLFSGSARMRRGANR